MNEIKSFVDGKEIIYSGQAHLMPDKELKIEVFNFEIQISFNIDTTIESKINWSNKENVLKIIFENYIQYGGGILIPWLIGTYNGKELYISIYSRLLEDGSSKFIFSEYILYGGKEVVIG